jgi:hypothetical protein
MTCENCGSIKATYNSCGNRHCPNCGQYKRDKWILMRQSEALPVKYFHVVFTIPHHFNAMCKQAPADLYNALFKCAWGTIKQFSKDHKFLGAKPGMVAVLHTWGQNISLHPHLHCLVPGGGITEQGKWRALKKSNGKFLFPVKALSLVFKAKFCAEISALLKEGKVKAPESEKNPFLWIDKIYRQKWVVFAKKPVPKGRQVVDYIGKYTHKVAISNSRIKAIDNDKVAFSWLDYRTSKVKEMSLAINEFVFRLLLHILPKGFRKIRYYGFMACKNKSSDLVAILNYLGEKPVKSLKGLP